MDEMTTMLQRIRTLSVQAANGTNTSSDRTSIQAEVTALSQEITRIACRTTFGGKKVLSGFGTTESLMTATSGKINFQVGSNHDDLQTLDMNIYENDRSGTVKKGKTAKFDVNALGDTKGEFLKKAAEGEKAYKAAVTAQDTAAQKAALDKYANYLTLTYDTNDKTKVTDAAAKTADDWLTNAAGETKTEFTTKATAAKTAYEKIADNSTEAELPDGTKLTFDTALTTKAAKQNAYLNAATGKGKVSDYISANADDSTKADAGTFTAVQSKAARAVDADGNTKIDDKGKEVDGWEQAKEDVNVFKDTASASNLSLVPKL